MAKIAQISLKPVGIIKETYQVSHCKEPKARLAFNTNFDEFKIPNLIRGQKIRHLPEW